MSLTQAVRELQTTKGAMAVQLAYVTLPTHRKRGNPFYDEVNKQWKIEKVGQFNGLTGVSYQNSVNNQRAREDNQDDFHSAPIWKGKGQHVDNFLVRHVDTNRQYLKVLPTAGTIKAQYRWVDSKEPLNDAENNLLSCFEVDHDVSARQETDKPVYWNLIALENLIQLTFNHKTYA
jgi:hypothetical protein